MLNTHTSHTDDGFLLDDSTENPANHAFQTHVVNQMRRLNLKPK